MIDKKVINKKWIIDLAIAHNERLMKLEKQVDKLKEQLDYINKKHNIDQNWNIEQINKLKGGKSL